MRKIVGRNRALLIVLSLIMILSAQTVMAYSGTVTGKELPKGGISKYLGSGTQYPNVSCARLKTTYSSHDLSTKYPLYFRLRTSSSELALSEKTKWSNLGTITSLNSYTTLNYGVYSNKLTRSKWYVFGQTDTKLSDSRTTVNCKWEY